MKHWYSIIGFRKAEQLQKESKLAFSDSLEVLHEFEKFEDEAM